MQGGRCDRWIFFKAAGLTSGFRGTVLPIPSLLYSVTFLNRSPSHGCLRKPGQLINCVWDEYDSRSAAALSGVLRIHGQVHPRGNGIISGMEAHGSQQPKYTGLAEPLQDQTAMIETE